MIELELDNNPTTDYNTKCLFSDYKRAVMDLTESSIKNLAVYNQLWMELDDLYGNYAKHCKLSDCPFWVFYTLYESRETYTQKELSEKLSLSRQTVNSALKSLEADGLIELVPLLGQKKNKQVILTETGNILAKERIVPIITAEQTAFEKLNEEEQKLLLSLTKKHIGFLHEEINKIQNMSSEDWSSQ